MKVDQCECHICSVYFKYQCEAVSLKTAKVFHKQHLSGCHNDIFVKAHNKTKPPGIVTFILTHFNHNQTAYLDI